MIVYLRIDVLDNCKSYTAYNVVVDSPAYIWRYTNYAEGTNYLRTYMHRAMTVTGLESLSLGVL